MLGLITYASLAAFSNYYLYITQLSCDEGGKGLSCPGGQVVHVSPSISNR